MPMPTRTRLGGRYGQATLDPGRPLYVCRRISRGAAGALAPGQILDVATVAPHRLRNLYRQGFVSHEMPKAVSVAQTVAAALARAAATVPPPTVAEAPAPAVVVEDPIVATVPPPAPLAQPRPQPGTYGRRGR